MSDNKLFNHIILLFLFLTLLYSPAYTQHLDLDKKISLDKLSGLLYHDNSELVQIINNNTIPLGINKYPLVSQLKMPNRFINTFDRESHDYKISEHYIFFNAIVNPDKTLAVLLERIAYKPIWNLWLIDLKTNRYTKLFDETTFPTKNIAPLIFGWDSEDNLLADAFRIDWSIENNGLLKINPRTKEVSDYHVEGSYIGQPIVSPDGKHLSYLATTDKKRDILHSPSNQLWIKELGGDQEHKIAEGSSFSLIGYSNNILTEKTVSNKDLNDQRKIKKSGAPTYRVPYPAGSKAYITRHGMTDPPDGCWPGNGDNCYGGGLDRHGDKIALDWSNLGPACNTGVSGSDQIEIIASSSGLVTWSRDLSGCGLTVKIASEGDGTVVRYCHLSSLTAVENEVWLQGLVIGNEGNTGNSTGEHLHQDFFAPNEEPSTRHYVKFEDCANSIPYSGYGYVSQNTAPIVFPCGADAREGESKKTNSSSCVDLTAECATLQSSVSQSGITLSGLTIHNLGLEPAIPYSVGFYLSQTNSFEDAIVLGYQQMHTLLSYESETIETQTFPISHVPTGTYYILTIVDLPNVVNDEFLDNNYCFGHGPLTIGSSTPTINLTSTSCATPVVNGNSLTLDYIISNLGTQASGNFHIAFYAYRLGVSQANLLDITELHQSINGTSSLSFSQTVDLNTMMTTAGLAAGEYFIGMDIDSNKDITETKENDNFCFNDVTFIYSGGCNSVDGVVAGNFTGNSEYSAPNYLIAAIPGASCRVNNAATLSLNAGGFVDLNPGFIAETGSVFNANINDCTQVNNILEVKQETELAEIKLDVKNTFFEILNEKENHSEVDHYLKVSPNPLTDIATIEFDIPETSLVNLALYNIQGQPVVQLIDSNVRTKGLHQHKFENPNLNSGLYILKLNYGNKNIFKKLIIN